MVANPWQSQRPTDIPYRYLGGLSAGTRFTSGELRTGSAKALPNRFWPLGFPDQGRRCRKQVGNHSAGAGRIRPLADSN